VVENMEDDARFCQNYFVTDPAFHLVFYVAAPLVASNGHRLGTLWVSARGQWGEGRTDPRAPMRGSEPPQSCWRCM
jgi:hypothetical protein